MLSCIVLSAGLGTRLDPLTRLVVKPAVPFGQSTLVEHILAWLARYEVRDVVINLHHLPATLTSVVGDGTHLGLSVRYSWEQPLLGSAGGPRRALPLLASDPILIVNGDVLCDLPLDAMLAAHRDSGADVTMALVPNMAPHHYNGVQLGDDDAVVGFVPRGDLASGTWHFIGVQIASRAVFEGLPDGVPAETVSGIYRERIAARPGTIRGYCIDKPFLDVGTPAEYLATAVATDAMEGGRLTRRSNHTPDDGTGRHAVELRESIVWPEVTLEPGVRLERCIVAGDVRLPAGFAASESIIVPSAVLRPGDRAATGAGFAVFPLKA